MTDTQTPETKTTRRGMIHKTVQLGATAVTVPSFASVVAADTDSGNVEAEITATVPTDTAVEVTIYEDTTGDGDEDRQQTESIDDGTNTVEYDLLESTTAQGDTLWAELALSTDDDSVTPEIDEMTITLPETPTTTTEPGTTQEPGTTREPADIDSEPQSIWELWDNFLVFVGITVLSFAGIGLASRSTAIAAYAGYLVFAYIALQTGHTLLINLLYISLTVIMIGMAFKIWRAEFGGE